MIPELGHFALILALLAAVVLGTLPLVGAGFGNRAPIAEWVRLARPAAQVVLLPTVEVIAKRPAIAQAEPLEPTARQLQ